MDFIKNSQTLLDVIQKYNNILIYIKGSPDPDVIATSFAIKEICEYFKKKAIIVSKTRISLLQNELLVRELSIPIKFIDDAFDYSKYSGYVVLDHQSAFIKEATNNIPCLIHIDHHALEQEDINPIFKMVSDEISATSTFFYFIVKKLNPLFSRQKFKKICTALCYGIYTDTNKLSIANELDKEAYHYLNFNANKKILHKIINTTFPKNLPTLVKTADEYKTVYQNWMFYGIRYLDASERDMIAIIADYLLTLNNSSSVVVYAIIKDVREDTLTLEASLRTSDKMIDLNRMIKSITSNGGARHYKGAFQIKLKYFKNCPDEKLLWDMIHITTVRNLSNGVDRLKSDKVTFFISKLTAVFKKNTKEN